MKTTIVNARVDIDDKVKADSVLRSSGHTWSEAIRALAAHMARTGEYPEVLTEKALDEAKEAEMERKLAAWADLKEIWRKIGPLSDEDVARIIDEEMMRRHG